MNNVEERNASSVVISIVEENVDEKEVERATEQEFREIRKCHDARAELEREER